MTGQVRQAQLDWLRRAIVSDRTGLIKRALARTDGVGQRSYGDSWLRRPILELIEEMRDECADILGWGGLAAERIRRLGDQHRAAKADAHLAAAVEYAGLADAELQRAARILGDSGAG